jgi:benzoate-CoA ligase family protein
MNQERDRYNASAVLDANLDAGRGEKVAIYCGDERVTYADLYARACAFGRALKALGIGREDRVLLALDDTPTFPVAFLGALRAGAVPVPVNPLYRAADHRYFVEDSGARVVVTERAHVAKLIEALDTSAEPVVLVAAGGAAAGALALEDLLAAYRGELPPADTHRDDMAFWLYSSGSTGKPKGVVHLQHDIPSTCETYGRHVLQISEADVVFARVLFHAYGLGNAISFPYAVGASTVLSPGRATPQGILQTIERFRPTLFFGVPTLYGAILSDPTAARRDLSSLRLCVSAAEPLPPETWRRWRDAFGLPILDGIGSTEMLHIFCSNTLAALRPGSSGKPVPGYDLKILDESGRPVGVGRVGDLYVAGDSAAPFYWHQPHKSAQTMRGEWVFTGDRYRVDGEGFYWYEGRSDDMIKVGGEWVSPIEIENVLMEHPAVQEAAVVGVPVEGIMRIKASVVLAAGQPPSPGLVADLQQWCKGRLQRYQYPHRVEFVVDLPRTVTGKIQRFKLREAAA